MAVVTDPDMTLHHTPRSNAAPGADFDTTPDHGESVNPGALANLGAALNEGPNGNARFDNGIRVEHPSSPGEGKIGIVADQCDQAIRRPVSVLLPDKAPSGAAFGVGCDILHIVEKREISTAGIRQSGHIVKQPRRVMGASDTSACCLKHGGECKGSLTPEKTGIRHVKLSPPAPERPEFP